MTAAGNLKRIAVFCTDMNRLTKSQKIRLYRIIAAAFIWAMFRIFVPEGQLRILYILPYLISGYDVILEALRNIRNGQVFDENFLMTIASIGAFCCGEAPEGVMVMVLYQVGELFQDIAVQRSRNSIAALLDLCPDEARVLRNGVIEIYPPEEVAIGETFLVYPGERIPLDGVILEGETTINTAPLTGESMPRSAEIGTAVFSGTINLSGDISVMATKPAEESSAAKIIELMEEASEKKAKTEHFISRFAKVYTPIVCISAFALAVIPSIITGDWMNWVYRAMTFLVISCPCALVISVPMSFFGGIGLASRNGVLVKSGLDLEKMADIRHMVFDKTGTLTTGDFSVTNIIAEKCSREELLYKAAYVESKSSHPLAKSIQKAYGKEIDSNKISHLQEQAGKGVVCNLDGNTVLAGNLRLLRDYGISVDGLNANSVVYIAENDQYLGVILCEDTIKQDAKNAIAELKEQGIRNFYMLSGDHKAPAEKVGKHLGMTAVYSQLLPDEKLAKLETLLSGKGTLAYVGDGINDAPVLCRADVGIAMGAMGSDAAIEAADVVLMDDNLMKLPAAIRIAKKTMIIVKQNIVFALGIKFLVMLLGALGQANMWMAIFADIGVAILCILNAFRLNFSSL